MTFDNKNEILIVDSHYLGCINYYKNLINYSKVEIERFEHYQKLSYRNRCYIAGPNGTILLSVPLLKGKNQRTVMKDVRIDNQQKWQSLHWKTLVSAYRRSPWFEYYEEELAPFFEKEYAFLFDWNLALFDAVNSWLGFQPSVELTREYLETYGENYTDRREHDLPPPSRHIPEPVVRYRQVFEDRTGFLPNLSILDLLVCEGKRAKDILLGTSPEEI